MQKKTMDRVAFGRRLNAIRKEQNITTERLSEMCGISAIFIRQIENATKLPSLPVFVRICNELRVAPRAVLCDSLVLTQEDEITALGEKLRTLTPRQYSTVMETINLLTDKLSMIDESE